MISMFTNTTVQGNGGMVDYRVDLRIPGYGPNAAAVPGIIYQIQQVLSYSTC